MTAEPAQRLWFKDAFESMFQGQLGPTLTLKMRAGLKDRGLNLGAPLLPAYSAEVWAACIRYAAAEVYPGVELDVGTYRLGELFSQSFTTGMLGRSIIAMLRLIGARRALPRMGRNFKNITNYIDVVVEERSQDCFAACFNEVDGIPYFFKGTVDAAGTSLGAPRPSASRLVTNGHTAMMYFDLRPLEASPFPSVADLEADSQRLLGEAPVGLPA